jgi:endonuclease I
MKKSLYKFLVIFSVLAVSHINFAQTVTSEMNSTTLVAQGDNNNALAPQADYYASVYKLTGTALRTALHNLIKGHTVITYGNLYSQAYPTTDNRPDGTIWDIYSDIPGGTPPYTYTLGTKQCGNYSGEGDCYNREHEWCEAWYGSSTSAPIYSDIFNVYPTDGYVNNRRSNYTYGEVTSATWTSKNGSKLGPNTFPGNTSTVFEPINAYKGDLARSHFYISTRYYTEDASWSTTAGTNKCEILAWYANMLYKWHMNDTVSTKEINRNNAIYALQKNRNPYIDHPEFVAEIWMNSMAPAVLSVSLSGNNAVVLRFSRLLDSAAAVTATNYISTVTPASVQWGVNNDYSKVLVTYPALASGTTYSLQLKNMKSINAVAMNDTTVSFRTSGFTAITEQTKKPETFNLQQNFPNPFNPSTEIRFELREAGNVTLRIYDILGNLVNELVNTRMSSGLHKVTFAGDNLSAGVYYYQLQVGSEAQTKKMILMK